MTSFTASLNRKLFNSFLKGFKNELNYYRKNGGYLYWLLNTVEGLPMFDECQMKMEIIDRLDFDTRVIFSKIHTAEINRLKRLTNKLQSKTGIEVQLTTEHTIHYLILTVMINAGLYDVTHYRQRHECESQESEERHYWE